MWHVDLAEGEQSFEAEAATLEDAHRLLEAKIPDGWIRVWNPKVLHERPRARVAQIAAPVDVALRSRSARARAAAVRELARAMAAGMRSRRDTFDIIVAALEPPHSGEVCDAVMLALRDSGDPRAIAVLTRIARESRARAARAVRILEELIRELPDSIASDDLQVLTTLDVSQTRLSPRRIAGHGARAAKIDCSALHDLARRELVRRQAS